MIDEAKILLASHIKPWAQFNNQGRLDINNGFTFISTIDELFDNGLIIFENNKELIVSPLLTIKIFNQLEFKRVRNTSNC